MASWKVAPAGSRRQAVRRRLDSISSRLLHRTILDFRLRLVLLAALTLPFILLGGLVHALASGNPWSTSAYVVYGLLFRVPSLGAVRLDEPAASALVLNAVFLFGTFGFAILLGLIGEEVKGTVKALRAGGAPLDVYGHVVLLNFTPDATAVALLRQVAEDVSKPGSQLYGRPIVVLASRPPPAGPPLAAGGSGMQRASGGGGDVEGPMKRVVADALQGYGSCEWHLRVGSSCRIDDLTRVCAATASYIVLLADPRVATSPDARAAGAASCLQAQSLMCLALAGAGGRGRAAAGGAGGGGGGGGSGTTWGGISRVRQLTAIVVQSPADAPQPLPLVGPPGGLGGAPIANFRAVAAAESSRPSVIEVCDRGIVDRVVAQTVLQPGVATVLARLFGGRGSGGSGGGSGGGTGFRWVEWPGFPPGPAVAAGDGGGATSHLNAASKGDSGGGGGGCFEVTVSGLRRRHMLTVPRTLSYSTCQRAVTAAEAVAIAATAGSNGNVEVADLDRQERCASVTVPATAATQARWMANQHGSTEHYEASSSGSGGGSGGGTISHPPSAKNSPWRTILLSLASAATAAMSGCRTTDSVAVPPPATSVPATTPLNRPKFSAPLPPMPNSCSSTRTCATFGEVRLALEAAAAADADVTRSGWRRRQPNVGASAFPYPSPSSASSPWARAVPTAGDGGNYLVSWSSFWRRTLVSEPVLVGYMSAATGTLRLNPRDTAPVYPGDKLVLLVSEEARGRVNPLSSSHLPAQYGSWRRMGNRARGKGAAGKSVVQPAVGVPVAAVTEAAAAAATTGAVRGRNSVTVGGSRLHFCSSDTAAAAAAAVQSPLTPLPPLQAWRSEPVDYEAERQLPPADAALGPTDGCAVDVTGDNGGTMGSTTYEQCTAEPSSTIVRDKPAASMHDSGVYCGVTVRAASSSSQAPTRSGLTGRSLTAPPPSPLPPPPPPPHIIVISRTAAAIREVVAGLLEFAPMGSTIALLTHESCTANVRQANADGGAGAGSSGQTLSAALSAGSVPCTTAATAAAIGNTAWNNGTTVVLPCPSSSWPVGESDLIVAGLAIATAVLVARDSGLQPHEADATALSAVLQLHQTLTDPTRSPLRRRLPPPPPPLQQATNDGAAASTSGCTAAAAAAAAAAAGAAAAEPLPYLLGEKLPCRTAFSASSAAATAAAAAATATASLPPAPLHVVVCLHSTRSRDTLRAFLSTLNVQPPFTLEALVPEEYRALLLAGVVRQPQSHAIMTELLSDRPGSPEVYLVPPARLLAAAASRGLYCGDVTSSAVAADRIQDQDLDLDPGSCMLWWSFSPTETDLRDVDRDPTAHTQPALGTAAAAAANRATHQPGMTSSPLPSWRFRDVAAVALGCGCTAIGVLRGGGGGGASDGDGDSEGGSCGSVLQLAPSRDLPLELSPEDRLVVLAANPL